MKNFVKTLTKSGAYLLVIHGSRDDRTHQGVQDLAQQVRIRLEREEQSAVVATATLELGEFPLHQQIVQLGDRLLWQGINHLHIIPLFLLPGVHVMEDIPAEVRLAQEAVGGKITLNLCPYLGTHPQLPTLFATQISQTDRETWILMAHGSRRAGGNQPIQTLADQLDIVDAYWSVMPSLEWRVSQLMDLGYRRIGIWPYFLFPGYITDAIADILSQIQSNYPQLNYAIGSPLSYHPQLAEMVLDLTVCLKVQR